MNNNWLLGYLEGQGRFSIVMKKSGPSKRLQVVADFSVKSDDSELLRDISKLFGGKIYSKSGAWVLKITKLKDILKVVKFFEGKEMTSKAQRETFQTWKECVKLIENKDHLTNEGMLAIATLRNNLHFKDKWNKKSFCAVKAEIDPCGMYKIYGEIPKGCRGCSEGSGR